MTDEQFRSIVTHLRIMIVFLGRARWGISGLSGNSCLEPMLPLLGS
jgi:hypothetical protein